MFRSKHKPPECQNCESLRRELDRLKHEFERKHALAQTNNLASQVESSKFGFHFRSNSLGMDIEA